MEEPLPSTSKVIDPAGEDLSENEQEPIQKEEKPVNVSFDNVTLMHFKLILSIIMSNFRCPQEQ